MKKIISVSKTRIWDGVMLMDGTFSNLLECLSYSNHVHKVEYLNLSKSETDVLSITITPKVERKEEIEITKVVNATWLNGARMPADVFGNWLEMLFLWSTFKHTVYSLDLKTNKRSVVFNKV